MARVLLDVSELRRCPAQPTGIPRVLAALARELVSRDDFDVRLCAIEGDEGLCETSAAAIFARLGTHPARGLTARVAGRLRRLWAAPRLSGIDDLGADDILVSLGGGWTSDPGATLYRRLKHEAGVRVVLVVYDLLPIRCPQLFPPIANQVFAPWLRNMAPLADLVLAISQRTREDFRTYCDELGVAGPPVEVIRLGEDFAPRASWPLLLPSDRPFALSVGTVEIRKNHGLLYRVWRRLLLDHGPKQIPSLVIAGGPGWLTGDLRYQIVADPLTRGHIHFLPRVTDAELAGLYDACLFTLYPSYAEGWGLPVAESLSRGKVCIASKSVAEVASCLLELHDADDLCGCLEQVQRFAFDAEARRQREMEIRARYVRTSWRDTATQVLKHLRAHLFISNAAPRMEGGCHAYADPAHAP